MVVDMKKIRVISVFMIFVLCAAVLCTGVYSISYISARIEGVVSVIPIQLRNAVEVKNSSNINAVVDCSVKNASKESLKRISKKGVWNSGVVEFSKELIDTRYRLPTIKMEMLVTNNSNKPISADIEEGENNLEQNSDIIKVTLLGCPYIEPGETGVVSIQFSVMCDRFKAEPSVPEVLTYAFVVKLNETEEALKPIVKYDNDTATKSMPRRGLYYYIEFGDNPYYTSTSTNEREKIRWYIWAKADGNGCATALEDGVDYNSSTKEFIGNGSKYFFISEYILNTNQTDIEVSFQNEMIYWSTAPSGINANDYANSNCRNYLNGDTVRSSFCFDDSGMNTVSSGKSINFFEYYKLTEDKTLGLIEKRSLKALYDNGANNGTNELPEERMNEADYFWCISYDEYYNFIRKGNNDNGKAYVLRSGVSGTWWLSTPEEGNDIREYYIYDDGRCLAEEVIADDWYIGVRPAFILEI